MDGMQSFCVAGTRISQKASNFQVDAADNSETSRGSTTFNSVSEHFSITFTSKLGLSGSVYGPAKHLSTFLHFGPSVNSKMFETSPKIV